MRTQFLSQQVVVFVWDFSFLYFCFDYLDGLGWTLGPDYQREPDCCQSLFLNWFSQCLFSIQQEPVLTSRNSVFNKYYWNDSAHCSIPVLIGGYPSEGQGEMSEAQVLSIIIMTIRLLFGFVCHLFALLVPGQPSIKTPQKIFTFAGYFHVRHLL